MGIHILGGKIKQKAKKCCRKRANHNSTTYPDVPITEEVGIEKRKKVPKRKL